MNEMPANTTFSPAQGRLLCLAGAVLWGTTGTAQALAPAEAGPEVIGTMRMVVGGAALLILALVRGHGRSMLGLPKKPALIGAVCMAAYQIFFFFGVAKTGIAVGTIVGIGSSPIWGGIWGFVFRGERPGREWFGATLLAVIGCALLVGGKGGNVVVDPLGVLLALGAGCTYALFSVFSKDLLEVLPPDAVMAVIFAAGAVMLAPILFFSDLAWLADPRGLAVSLHLGLIATAASYMLYSRGLTAVPVATATTLALGEPLTAGLLGILLIGERLGPQSFIGIALLFLGLALLSLNLKALFRRRRPV